MILPLKLSMRFFRLFYLLCTYVHNKLHVVSDAVFFTGEPPRGISHVGERLTIDAMWEDVSIVQDYVQENPDGLSASDLATVQGWTHAYGCIAYVARCDDGKVRLFVDDYVVDVHGMSLDLDSALPKLPILTHTTLLPYDDYVVYDTKLEQLPVVPSQNVLEVFDEGMRDALREGRTIRTGQEFLSTIPLMKRRKEEAGLDRFMHDMEMEERAQGKLEGQHRGALAGLAGNERDAAIQRHVREFDTRDDDHATQLLARYVDDCLTGEPVLGLRELVERHMRDSYEQILESADALEKEFGDRVGSSSIVTKRVHAIQDMFSDEAEMMALVDEGVEEYLDSSNLQAIINGLSKPQIKRMRELAEEGGYRTCADDPLPSTDEVPEPVEGMCYLFHTKGTFHVVMPHEIVPLVRKLDWDEAFARERYVHRLSAFFDCVSDLRGIVEVDAAIDEFVRNFDDGSHSAEEVYETLLDCLEIEHIDSTILKTKERQYLLHFELFAMYQERRGEGPYTDKYLVEGPLTDVLEGLMHNQRGKKPRPVTEEMLECGSGYAWRQAQQPALAMRAYLDEHVPDGEDDFFYADGVMEELLAEQMYGIATEGVDFFFETLEAYGFVPDECQLQTLLTLWQNMCNGLPVWPNNGWSPNEIRDHMQGGRRASGRRVFYNPDGSVMKVGRNDPCPCGSGKKYKRCCGR